MSGGVFKFGLQRVLELREKREQEVATALAAAQGAAETARAAVQDLEQLRDAGRDRLTTAGGTVGELRNLGYIVEQLDRRVADAEGVARRADAIVQEAQSTLRLAFQDRRVLDRLRDKQLDAYRAGEVNLDRQTMDDIALARFGRRGATE